MRIKSSQEQKTSLRRVLLILSSVTVLLSIVLIFLINLADNRKAYAAPVNGDYQSKGSGNWSNSATWQKYAGGWANAPSAPTSADKIITILNGHTVTVTANVTVDQVIVNSGGVLIINSGITLTLANGAGTDLDVTGIVKNAGTITINAGGAIVFQSGGKYQHNYTTTAGTIPAATWSAGSTCEVIGYTSNAAAPAGLQAFSNFTWNCPSQAADINLSAGLNTINGDFTITSTGTKILQMATSAITLNVGGNFIQSGGILELIKGNAVSTMNLTGDYSQTGGTFTVADGNNNTTINLFGNMTQSGGTITQIGSSVVSLIFKKAGTQIYIASGNAVTGNIDYTVNSGSIIDVGTSIVIGRNFTLSSGGGIVMGSTAGISNSGATGNIQVSAARSFNTNADYTYNGASAQVTGSGLPANVKNLTVNNAADVTLTNTVAVTNILTLTTGNIITGSNEVQITNTSTSAITGYSASNYIFGNLRRSISASGSYDFPIGTSVNYEIVNLNLSGIAGPSNVLATFTNASPLVAGLPLTGVIVNNLTIDKMLTYGFWTLVPNSPLISGSYTLTATEVVSNFIVNSGCSYSMLNRPDNTVAWSSQGTQSQNTQTVNGNAVTAVRSALNLFGDFSIGYGELLSFSNPTLVSGVAGQVNAIYVFPDACSNVDAWIEILSLDGGATLNSIDNFSAGNGYQESWQPFVNAPANSTSSILWRISFKVANTATDTILPWLAISGVDIDAGNNVLEFVEATYPYSYGLAPGSPLTITNNNGNYRATANAAGGSIANIDTAQTQAMFQINYKNVNSFLYRTGVISTNNSAQTRQTSLYFKSFFSNNLALPIRLLYFEGRLNNNKVKLSWATASETNNSYFTVERSAGGENFEQVNKQYGAGNSTMTLYYAATDENPLTGSSYYRLKQTDYDGHFTYSDIIGIRNNYEKISELYFQSISPNPFTESFKVNFIAQSSENVNIRLFNSTGQVIAQDNIQAKEGFNNYEFQDLKDLSKGIYFISIICGNQEVAKKIIRK